MHYSISSWLKENIQLFCIGRCIIVIITFLYIISHVYVLFYTHNKDIIITIIIIKLEQHDFKILKLKHKFLFVKEIGSASIYTYKYIFIVALSIFTFKFIRVPAHIALSIFTFKFIRMLLEPQVT